MTEEEKAMALLLHNKCTYLPGSFHKKFAKEMALLATSKEAKELSIRQSLWLRYQFYTYRKQIGSVGFNKYSSLALDKSNYEKAIAKLNQQ
jgi:hypothetical protein